MADWDQLVPSDANQAKRASDLACSHMLFGPQISVIFTFRAYVVVPTLLT